MKVGSSEGVNTEIGLWCAHLWHLIIATQKKKKPHLPNWKLQLFPNQAEEGGAWSLTHAQSNLREGDPSVGWFKFQLITDSFGKRDQTDRANKSREILLSFCLARDGHPILLLLVKLILYSIQLCIAYQVFIKLTHYFLSDQWWNHIYSLLNLESTFLIMKTSR